MPTKDYNELLHESLKNIDEAALYLTACYEDSEEVFLQGLRKVAEAQGGVAKLAKKAKMSRESLYRMLSDRGNPQLSNLTTILEKIGLSVQFSPVPKKRAA